MPDNEQGPRVLTRPEEDGEQISAPPQMVESAESLARTQEASVEAARERSVLSYLDAQQQTLEQAYRFFVEQSETELSISYAGEWMLDNFYVVQQTLRQVRKNMPEHYYRELPVLINTEAAGYPRVYVLAREIAQLCHSGIDLDEVKGFLRTYQSAASLTMGELWALPTMLRIAVLENVTAALLQIAELQAPPDPASLYALRPLVQDVSEEQTVANGIRSLHLLLNQDWEGFFEELSQVEAILRQDPAGVYPHMDFDTRDLYRKRVEALAKRSGLDEVYIAEAAIDLAESRQEPSRDGDQLMSHSHVGHLLVGQAIQQLERRLGFRPAWPVRLRRWLSRHATLLYLGATSLITLAIAVILASLARSAGGGPGIAIVAGLFSLVPASTASVDLVNWLLTRIVPPKKLPKLDLSDGVPERYSTMVVIPALLSSESDADSLLQQIELHYLSNSDPNLHFALLTDFGDAPLQHTPEDEALLNRARVGIQQLNRRHDRQGAPPFHLYHRERRWNPSEGKWMGWERKRGKLAEFNRLILGQGDTSYAVKLGDEQALSRIRYVITLDADTLLPRESARRLVGTLAHPLNRVRFDEQSGRVVSGYTVLQPRAQIQPTSINESLFARIYSGDTTMDLYSRAVSDVYQDVFGEGIFVGKGIYDVASFEKSLDGRVPDNALLSHDLFEGIHGRAGLVTDVVLYEDYPPHYLAYAHRMHRWIRGDWQLLPWLLLQVPHETEGRVPNPLSALDRWKIVDNLRRSLSLPAVLLFLVAGWLFLPGSPWLWTLAGILIPAVSLLTLTATESVEWAKGATTLRESLRGLSDDVLRWLLTLVFMPYQVLITIDAIGSTLVRLLITHRHLLQWTTAAHTIRLFGREMKVSVTWMRMGGAPLFALVTGVSIGLLAPGSLLSALPLLIAWLVSPQVAHWVSQPVERKEERLTDQQRQRLRHLARRTWLYFERFVGPEDHWLPPDHFQEDPLGVVAHRTSPTNIGLLLLSTAGAYDFGYIGLLELAIRLRDTLDTIHELEHYRGHLLNWYNTRTLEPLRPRYVSTVDSGNLAGCLVILSQACDDVPDDPLLRWDAWQGFFDSCALFLDALRDTGRPSSQVAVSALKDTLTGFEQRVLAARANPAAWPGILRGLSSTGLSTFNEHVRAYVEAQSDELDSTTLREMRVWTERMQYHLNRMQHQIDELLPWWNALLDVPAPIGGADSGGEMGALWASLEEVLTRVPTLAEVPQLCRAARVQLGELQSLLREQAEGKEDTAAQDEGLAWCQRLLDQLNRAQVDAGGLLVAFEEIGRHANEAVQEMDFRFLLDPQREVFRIGYNVMAEALDNSYYDLLASEARIASLIAICKGEVEQSHWLHLARPLAEVEGTRALLSWSGTMFEYLMPTLFAESYPGTLLEQSCRAAIDRHIAYGRRNGVPWGVSESSYYQFDAHRGYQYKAFGVPGLGLKRGLADDLVIAPYASMLALPFRPAAVMENLDRFESLSALGQYGLFESIDYTRPRLPVGQRRAVVRTYMAHHQAMIFVSLSNSLLEGIMLRRFHRDQRVRSVEILLHEQVPQTAPLEEITEEEASAMPRAEPEMPVSAWDAVPRAVLPVLRLLSNGTYTTYITAAGGGWSEYTLESIDGTAAGETVALTRWRADSTRDNWGTWIYFRDLETGDLWNVTAQPTSADTDQREVSLAPHQAEFRYRRGDLTMRLQVTVPPGDSVEVRRVTVVNHSDAPRRLLVTSYAELVLNAQQTDRRHPAFNKLFIQSEFLTERKTLVYRRRPRSGKEASLYFAHTVVAENDPVGPLSHDADRASFLGRGRTVAAPQALLDGDALAGHTGATLDPIMSLGEQIQLAPHSASNLAFISAAARSHSGVTGLIERYHHWDAVERAFDQARSQSAYSMSELDLTSDDVQRTDRLLSALLYPHPGLRAPAEWLARNTKGQPALWAQGISGDYPILVVRVHNQDELDLVGEILKAHAYWRRRRVQIDLVLLNERETGYGQELNAQLRRLVDRTGAEGLLNQRGGIYLLRTDQIEDADQTLLLTAARVVLDGAKGTLSDQLAALEQRPVRLPALQPTYPGIREAEPTPSLERPEELLFDNGFGGFTPDGQEYVIDLEPGEWPPAPWINVIANAEFGFLVSEGGLGYTWAGNSGENRLTPWHNDPVSDTPAEAVYLRDEETGQVWTPTPLPRRVRAPYLVRHGAGYTVFQHSSHGLKQEMTLFAARDDPVKLIRVRLENSWNRGRRITATYYAEWVLGVSRQDAQQYVIPDFEGDTETLLARNPYNVEFAERVAFAAASESLHGMTADRAEFLGELGGLVFPAALGRVGLEGRVRAGLDPCAALQIHIDLQPGEAKEFHFLLGQGLNREHALALVQRYRAPGAVDASFEEVRRYWDGLLGTVSVDTPDHAMNLLLNRWLLYQALACRVWGRSALYQSSGAYGFRDQLQDVTSLLHAAPGLAREHILRSARHQFEAGDALHWWHPPSGRGVRTRISDDLLWLPFVTAHYVRSTGDAAILQEELPFRMADPLSADEEERYGHYPTTHDSYSLFEHCVRALERGATSGEHGLPLMGSGDWNDGMNRVGVEGEGESVWLGWFLYANLIQFADLCATQDEHQRAEQYRQRAERLRQALEEEAWDGEWYRRAYYDDGTPLGSAQNGECRIDSIAQSWGVLSGAADEERARRAMSAVGEWLVREDDRLLLLFAPPFDQTPKDPGYIKGYPPGIRENGGQYTHAALWAVWAYAEMGQGTRAHALYSLLNPILHSDTAEKAERYKVEPYVVAADVYGVSPHIGRGGWTWYTGSSGWMYRLGLEAILGISREGAQLRVDPRIPADWDGFSVRYRYGQSSYTIHVENPDHVQRGVAGVTLDGEALAEALVPLHDGGHEHEVHVVMGESPS